MQTLTPPEFPGHPTNANIETLVDILRHIRQWTTAASLLTIFGLEDVEWRRRWLRGLAEAASPHIICGQLGYKHVENATPEELAHCIAWLESQAGKMSARAQALREHLPAPASASESSPR